MIIIIFTFLLVLHQSSSELYIPKGFPLIYATRENATEKYAVTSNCTGSLVFAKTANYPDWIPYVETFPNCSSSFTSCELSLCNILSIYSAGYKFKLDGKFVFKVGDAFTDDLSLYFSLRYLTNLDTAIFFNIFRHDSLGQALQFYKEAIIRSTGHQILSRPQYFYGHVQFMYPVPECVCNADCILPSFCGETVEVHAFGDSFNASSFHGVAGNHRNLRPVPSRVYSPDSNFDTALFQYQFDGYHWAITTRYGLDSTLNSFLYSTMSKTPNKGYCKNVPDYYDSVYYTNNLNSLNVYSFRFPFNDTHTIDFYGNFKGQIVRKTNICCDGFKPQSHPGWLWWILSPITAAFSENIAGLKSFLMNTFNDIAAQVVDFLSVILVQIIDELSILLTTGIHEIIPIIRSVLNLVRNLIVTLQNNLPVGPFICFYLLSYYFTRSPMLSVLFSLGMTSLSN